MKIILDESVPQKLRLLIGGGHTVINDLVSRLVRPAERGVVETRRKKRASIFSLRRIKRSATNKT
jgi:hypothetical protein